MRRSPDPRVLAHLAYTTNFEQVINTSVSKTGVYGAIMAVAGASGSVTIATPPITADLTHAKNGFDFAVCNVDGANTVVIDASADSKTINGTSTLTLPASPGASAWLHLDLTTGEWIAIFLSAGSAGAFLPTYTARGPISAYAITGTAAAVPQTTIVTAPFSASQKAIITYSVEVQTVAGAQTNITAQIFDGVAASAIDTFEQSCGSTDAGELTWHNTFSWTLEILGNGAARTLGLAVSDVSPGNCSVQPQRCRGVVQIVGA